MVLGVVFVGRERVLDLVEKDGEVGERSSGVRGGRVHGCVCLGLSWEWNGI